MTSHTLSTESNSQKRLGSVLFYGIVILLAYFVYLVFEPFLEALRFEFEVGYVSIVGVGKGNINRAAV